MHKAGDIAPWSFYRNDNLNQIIDVTPKSNQLTLASKKKLSSEGQQAKTQSSAGIKKNKSISYKGEINLKPKPISKSNLQMYGPIIHTPPQMIQAKHEIQMLNNRYMLLVIIRENLKELQRQKYQKINKQRIECLFPILKPRDALNLKRMKSNLQYPIDLFKYKFSVMDNRKQHSALDYHQFNRI